MAHLYPDESKYSSLGWKLNAFNTLLKWGVAEGMSDLIVTSGEPIWLRLYGQWETASIRPLTISEVGQLLDSMMESNVASSSVLSGREMDFLYGVPLGKGESLRFRGNAAPVSNGLETGLTVILRTIPGVPPDIEALGLEPELMASITPPNGLVLVTGVMGSGKTTTLSSVLAHIARTSRRHIITFEQPIEFDLTDLPGRQGPVEQSNIPYHFESFKKGTRNSTRRAADVILIGESRDPETLRGMLEAAEIGVAAYSTVHTRSVAATFTRIINAFPPDEQNLMASSLMSSIRVIVQQRLFPSLDGKRKAAREFLVFSQKMRRDLLKTPLPDLDAAVEELVQAHGQSLEKSTRNLVENGQISEEYLDAVLAEKSLEK